MMDKSKLDPKLLTPEMLKMLSYLDKPRYGVPLQWTSGLIQDQSSTAPMFLADERGGSVGKTISLDEAVKLVKQNPKLGQYLYPLQSPRHGKTLTTPEWNNFLQGNLPPKIIKAPIGGQSFNHLIVDDLYTANAEEPPSRSLLEEVWSTRYAGYDKLLMEQHSIIAQIAKAMEEKKARIEAIKKKRIEHYRYSDGDFAAQNTNLARRGASVSEQFTALVNYRKTFYYGQYAKPIEKRTLLTEEDKERLGYFETRGGNIV